MEKKKVLLLWWYDRADLIEPFIRLKDDFEFTVLFYRFPEQENKDIADKLPFRRIYWTNYPTPVHLIKDVRPEMAILFGITGSTTLALMLALKSRGIPYHYLSHGIIMDMDKVLEDLHINRNLANVDDRYKVDNPIYQKKKWHSWIFLFFTPFLTSFKNFLPVFQFLWLTFRRNNQYKILKKIDGKFWLPDLFILFAPHYSLFFKNFLGVPDNRFAYIGPLLMDDLFKQLNQDVPAVEDSSPYWLFIDQPLLGMPENLRHGLIGRVAKHCMEKGKIFIVKMHPSDYDKNIEFGYGAIIVKQHANLAEVINKAEVCLGFYSALLLAVIPFKKTVIFQHQQSRSPISEAWGKTGAVKLMDVDFQSMEEVESFERSEESRKEFVQKFVAFTDGLSLNRLRKILEV